MNDTTEAWNDLDLLGRDELLALLKKVAAGGVMLNFQGKRYARQIQKKVRPRVMKVDRDLCCGPEAEQARNLIVEGENLQAMVTLYKYRGQVDLIVTDPPYNTGQQFRYNDRWDTDPNDPDLGTPVALEDGSRHTKWMKAIYPRLAMMKAMLKPNGVIAVCIDDNELFHLGMMMDEIFGEENRIAILNWQKSYAPKNDSKHVSTATEYVLVYAKEKEVSKTGLFSRDEAMNAKYKNPDGDPEGIWRDDNATVATPSEKDRYAIQSPFTGALHYPGARAWAHPKKSMKQWLEAWGSAYAERDLGDGRPKALVIKGAAIPPIPADANLDDRPVVELAEAAEADGALAAARAAAEQLRAESVWPMLYFTSQGQGRPAIKRHLNRVKKGKVPMTYWADEDYEEPVVLGVQSWDHGESGHSQSGIKELDAILGKGHNFQTVKPLKLIKKIIQLWCPPNGLVLDPYAGSGTTGHAVLELNREADAARRFILIEQGSPESGDTYARSLTRERLCRAISGERPNRQGELTVTAAPLPGGFEYRVLQDRIDAAAVLSMKKEELVDVVITSHWDADRRGGAHLIRVDEPGYEYLVAKDEGQEGYFLIWEPDGSVGQLDLQTFRAVHAEAQRAGLRLPYHVYARYEVLSTPGVHFYKIPDKILSHLGLNEHRDSYHEAGER